MVRRNQEIVVSFNQILKLGTIGRVKEITRQAGIQRNKVIKQLKGNG